jgi:NAD(P)-dependent dehydrogenase (short-subunit alcohol dehydrogenase family)
MSERDGPGRRGACDDRIALVTGASRGIGAAIAQRLAAEGAAVAAVARTLDPHPHLPGTLRETVAAIEKGGGRAIAVQADLSDPDSKARLHQEVCAQLGDVDILVNNAAAAFYMPFERFSASRFRVALEINVRTPFELAQRVVPAMRERGRGWILNVSSYTARKPVGPPYSAWERGGGAILYGTTKAALDRLTTGLAAELYDDGIAVNSLAPVAAVVTPGVQALGIDLENVTVEPVEALAEAALALCTGDPASLTGRLAQATPFLQEIGRA